MTDQKSEELEKWIWARITNKSHIWIGCGCRASQTQWVSKGCCFCHFLYKQNLDLGNGREAAIFVFSPRYDMIYDV